MNVFMCDLTFYFIVLINQVNYRENGMVQGAVVQKYLLEKSRIVSQVCL